jgi:prepilin-type N-terminal cleavage/methylation domain-containing protein
MSGVRLFQSYVHIQDVTMKSRNGFTLIELLVVIAIIALLLAIILPSLRMVKEQARRMICATHLKSIGTGLALYSEANDNKAIPNYNISDDSETYDLKSSWNPWNSYIVGEDEDTSSPAPPKPVQLGKLYREGLIDIPDVYYCPTAQSNKLRDEYIMKYYTQPGLAKLMPPGNHNWGIPSGDNRCRANYMYYIWGESTYLDLSIRPIVIDRISSSGGIAHRKNDEPFGINALFGDGHANLTRTSTGDELTQLVQLGYDDLGTNLPNFIAILRLLTP